MYDIHEMNRIARDNVERHLGDCEVEDLDEMFDNAYVLAFDALHDRGVPHQTAREIARKLARELTS